MRFVHVPVLGAGGYQPITIHTGTVCLAKNAAAAASRCRLRARPAAQRVQGVRRQRHLRARAGAQCVQGVRRRQICEKRNRRRRRRKRLQAPQGASGCYGAPLESVIRINITDELRTWYAGHF